jgi:hypothetical protein
MIDNSSKKQDRKTFQSAPKEIEAPNAVVQKAETYSTIQPQQEVKQTPDFNNEPSIVQPQSVPARTTARNEQYSKSSGEYNPEPKRAGEEKRGSPC